MKQARKFGDHLIVVVARDKTVLKIKKQGTVNSEQHRMKIIKESKLANKVILGSLGDKYRVIKMHKPNIICLGYDQKFFVDKLTDRIKKYKLKTKIIRLKPYKPEIYKSSKLRKIRSLK